MGICSSSALEQRVTDLEAENETLKAAAKKLSDESHSELDAKPVKKKGGKFKCKICGNFNG